MAVKKAIKTKKKHIKKIQTKKAAAKKIVAKKAPPKKAPANKAKTKKVSPKKVTKISSVANNKSKIAPYKVKKNEKYMNCRS